MDVSSHPSTPAASAGGLLTLHLNNRMSHMNDREEVVCRRCISSSKEPN